MRSTLMQVLLVFILFAFQHCVAASAPPEQEPEIYGEWTIVSWLDSADISALPQAQVEALIGKPIDIRPDRFMFNGRTCKNPRYRRKIEESFRYFYNEWRIHPEKLRLPERVVTIETGCNMLFLKGSDKLVIEVDGNFLEAVRVRRLTKLPAPLQ